MAAVRAMNETELRKRITQIHLDPTLTEQEKAKKRQELLSGQWAKPAAEEEPESSKGMKSYLPGPCSGVSHDMASPMVIIQSQKRGLIFSALAQAAQPEACTYGDFESV